MALEVILCLIERRVVEIDMVDQTTMRMMFEETLGTWEVDSYSNLTRTKSYSTIGHGCALFMQALVKCPETTRLEMI